MVTTRAVNLVSQCSRAPCNGWQRTALGLFAKRLHPKTKEPITQPWPYSPEMFQCSVAVAAPSVASGEHQDGTFGPGSGVGSGGGEGGGGAGSGVVHPLGECSVGTPAVPWDLPAGLAGEDTSEGEG